MHAFEIEYSRLPNRRPGTLIFFREKIHPGHAYSRDPVYLILQFFPCTLFIFSAMAYSIYGPTSCRQKIELGILGLSAIKPRCSVYLAACPAYVGTNISFGRNYWGKYGPFVLFAISVNKSVAFIFLVTYFLQHIYMYSSSTLVNLQAIYSTRSLVIGVYTGKPFNVFSK